VPGWPEIVFFSAAAALLAIAAVPALRTYRALFIGGAVLMLITALFPRPGNRLGQYLFASDGVSLRLPMELFGIAWWILGAWLVRSLFQLLLRHTLFPDDNEPHARRLFADLLSALIYVVAIVGIMETVLKQPISAVLATSGVLAIILGLALQNTLSDVFAGLAINIERPFGAGDWITVSHDVDGQVIQINWRATRIKTAANDIIVIPNSVVAKAIVTNHRRLRDPRINTLAVRISSGVPAAQVIGALQAAAAGSPGLATGTTPKALACAFADGAIAYELTYEVDDYTLTCDVTSAVIARVARAFMHEGIAIGAPALRLQLPEIPALSTAVR
jgi:small-conductance mechanosensitive channel